MANSSRRKIIWFLFALELFSLGLAGASNYFSQKNMWGPFFWVIALSAGIFAVTKVFQMKPELQELLAFEDAAGRLARSASQHGITRLYNMQMPEDQAARNTDTQSVISKADAMWLCANSGASYLDPGLYRHWPAVERRLRDGVPFKVVLLAPSSREKALRNQLNVGQEADDSKLNLANLIRLYNQYPSLEIRLVERGMYGTVFATPTSLFYDPYHLAVVYQRIENRSFCLQIERKAVTQGVGHYEIFKSHFESLWRTSMDIEEWLAENTEFHPSLPAVKPRHRSWQADDK